MGRYYKKYNMIWPREQILETANTVSYKQGHDRAGILWPVDEAPIPKCDWADALSKFTGSTVNRMFFSRVHWGGLPIHRDHNRLCCLNFFITGDFENSYNLFVDDFDEPIEEFNGTSPTLMNTRQFHGIKNKTNQPRIVLSVSFYEPYKIIEQRGFKNNEVFYINE